MTEHIVLAGGCFWCTEAVFQRLRGVLSVIPGYSGGTTENPSYDEVATGTTGHAEALSISFDPAVLPLEKLLEVFFHLHDPTILNRQGNDTGTAYRSAIFYANDTQQKKAEKVKSAIEATPLWGGRPFVTEIVELKKFYPAESYHKDYYNKNSYMPYCTYVIDPKIKKLYKDFKDLTVENNP